MKLRLFIAVGIFSVIAFSSCLKDTPYMDVSNTEPIIEFGQSAANGIYGANNYFGAFAYVPENVSYDTVITAGPPIDTTITTVIAVNDTAIAVDLASPQVLSDTVLVTFTIDTTQIAPYNTSAGTSFTLLPSNLYTLNGDTSHALIQTIKILPGHRVGSIPVVLNFPAFPSSYNYALPISIINAVDIGNSNDIIVTSSNSGKFMWLLSQ